MSYFQALSLRNRVCYENKCKPPGLIEHCLLWKSDLIHSEPSIIIISEVEQTPLAT